MATITKFEDTECWQQARKLIHQLYQSKNGYGHDYVYKDQLMKSAYSVMNNIVEGFGRRSNKEFARYLEIACGSCFEIKSMVYVGCDLGYFNNDEQKLLFASLDIVERKIKGLLKYLRSK